MPTRSSAGATARRSGGPGPTPRRQRRSPRGRVKPGRRNASRRKAARSGEYWSPGLLRPGDVEFTGSSDFRWG
ncbi:hypothetical protein ACFPRL_26120 [Pseudoclavibacter helvolus]